MGGKGEYKKKGGRPGSPKRGKSKRVGKKRGEVPVKSLGGKLKEGPAGNTDQKKKIWFKNMPKERGKKNSFRGG